MGLRLVSSGFRVTGDGAIRAQGGGDLRITAPIMHDVGGGAVIQRLDDRLNAVEAGLKAALPTRVISRSLKHYSEQTDVDLAAGVVTLVAAGEDDYKGAPGLPALEGTQHVLLLGHLRVAEADPASAVEAGEIEIIEEIKDFVRTGLDGMRLGLKEVQHSRQLDHPYGWLVAYIDIATR